MSFKHDAGIFLIFQFIEPITYKNRYKRGVRYIKTSLQVLPTDNNEKDEYLIRRLTILQRCHFSLCEISNSMVSLFAMPIISITLVSFIGLIINLYEGFKWVILKGQSDVYLIMTCLKWAVYDAFKIIASALPFWFLQQEVGLSRLNFVCF